MAMVEPAINTVAFHFHEKIWNRLQKRKVANALQITQPLRVN
jgi:uncharacterized membrane protein